MKYLVKDLKKVNKQTPLNLKSVEQAGFIDSKNSSNTAKFHQQFLQFNQPRPQDLNLKQKSQSIFTNTEKSAKAQKNLENIQPLKPRAAVFYLPETRFTPPTWPGRLNTKRFFSSLRFAALGLLIAFTLNIFNVVQNGYNLKSVLISSASEGFTGILNATNAVKNKNFNAAQGAFAEAEKSFNLAQEKISFLNAAQNADLTTERNTSSVTHLLTSGQELSQAGNLFSQAAQDLQNLPTLFIQANKDLILKKATKAVQPASINESTQPPRNSITTLLKADLDKVDQAINHLKTAQTELALTDANLLPAKYRPELQTIQDKLATLNQFLGQMRDNFPAILNLLGDRYPHRYLLLLQNDTEARPTGGFIGSLMILDLNDGYITRADFHDVYDYDGQLLEKIPPPEEIAKITDSWHLRDSNYSPDFALSAAKAAWFLQKSKGPSVDTVIAINQSVMTDLLKLTGPVQIPELKSALDSSNFQFILSYLIESKYYGKAQPKAILVKVIQAFQSKLLKLDNWTALFGLISHDISSHKILFYSRDEQVQNFFEFLHLTLHQQTLTDGQDYLQVIASSVGGNKSDAFMTQDLNHQTIIANDGSITDELTITRSHNWTLADYDQWTATLKKFGFKDLPDYLADIMGRGINKASLKVYLPLGTELDNVVGIDPTTTSMRSDADLKKSYLLFSMNTAPGAPSKVILRYHLPTKLKFLPADIYRFSAQGQPGLVPTTLEQQLKVAPELGILKSSETLSGNLQTDFYYSAAISS